MQRVVVIALMAVSYSGAAQAYEELVFHQPSDLVSWCKYKAESRYIAKYVTPEQWNATYSEQDKVFHVDATLVANGTEVQVHCEVPKGAHDRKASIKIEDPNAL